MGRQTTIQFPGKLSRTRWQETGNSKEVCETLRQNSERRANTGKDASEVSSGSQDLLAGSACKTLRADPEECPTLYLPAGCGEGGCCTEVFSNS